jgi:PKD repeat protein
MSDFFYNRSDFTVTDYKGDSTTLSSYNLSITPLTFRRRSLLDIGENTKIVWDLGDGTTSEEQSPVHAYREPGLYKVKAIYYNCSNNGVVTEIYKDILIKDYLIDTFSATVESGVLSCTSGGLSVPITITQTVPYTETRSNIINYTVTGTTTPWYYKKEHKYSCLLPHHALYNVRSVDGTDLLIPVYQLRVASNAIYGRIQDGEIILSPTKIKSSILLGYSGTQIVYYRDDTLSGNIAISFSRQILRGVNTIKTTLTGVVLENQNVSHLSITSNGIDGDSYPTKTYDIGTTKLVNTKIPFVVKTKDIFYNTVKNFLNPVNITNITVRAGDSIISNYTINSLQHTITSVGGEQCAFRGYLEFNNVTVPLTGVRIYAQIQATNINSTSFGLISGSSSPFTVYPKNYYSLNKVDENYDMGAALKSLGTAEPLVDKDILFEKFFGVILGDNTLDINGLGKKVYERISNFVDNTTYLKTADVFRLISICKMMDADVDVFDSSLLSYPTEIKRLINLLSINKSALFGVQNSFIRDFDDNGEPGSGEYGSNLGSIIDIDNFIVIPSENKHIVAYEKFSKSYTLLNTFQPLKGIYYTSLERESGNSLELITENNEDIFVEGMYFIKDYDRTWGWPLVLPSDYTVGDLSKYYIFYEFVDKKAEGIIGGIIDFDISTVQNNATYDELYKAGGVFENLIANTLYLSLSLTK